MIMLSPVMLHRYGEFSDNDIGQKIYTYCFNWKYHTTDQCRDKRTVHFLGNRSNTRAMTTSNGRDKRSLLSTCAGNGKFFVDSRNHLEVLCDFSTCYDRGIVSNIFWERETNLRRPWYYPDFDRDTSIVRIGPYKSLLRIRNYSPGKDDGVYRCHADMQIYPRGRGCYRNYRSKRHTSCNGRKIVQRVFLNTFVFGRPYRQNSALLYDNIGYDHPRYRNRHENRQNNQNYYKYNRGNKLAQINFG